MQKIIILGASGMIGSTIFKYLSIKKNIKVFGTYHSNKLPFKNIIKFDYLNDKLDFLKNYDLVINCIGITKHNKNISNIEITYSLNINLPLALNDLAKNKYLNVIHISTDCIFSGLKGNYKENDQDFSVDIYGQTKRIGELVMKNSLVIRTSTIGHEFYQKNGLLEWFLSRKNTCSGYCNAFFNGLTTLELAKIIYKFFIMKRYFPKTLLNITSNKISKYELLNEIKNIYGLKIKIKKDLNFKIDRSLNNSKFINLTDYKPKTWYKMLKENKNYLKNV